MNSNLTPLALALLSLLAVGCASGPKYADVVDRIPEIPSDHGRIYFYRPSAFGAAVQPAVRLNHEIVGKCVPKGFFFVDRPPGDCVVACATESEHRVSFTLEENQVRYVKLVIQMGFFVGHVLPELVDEEQALEDLAGMKYVGEVTLAGDLQPPDAAPSEASEARDAPEAARATP